MTRSTAIATAAAIHVGKLMATAIVLFAGFEAVTAMQMWWQAKGEGRGE